MSKYISCKFCKNNLKLKVRMGIDRHGTSRMLRYIICNVCDVNSYYDDQLSLIKLVYHLRQPNFEFLSMNIVARHTTIGFCEEQTQYNSRFLEVSGVWPDTLPQDSFTLTQRLLKLAAFA